MGIPLVRRSGLKEPASREYQVIGGISPVSLDVDLKPLFLRWIFPYESSWLEHRPDN